MQSRVNSLKTKVLIAPLDWGLGHATRCIPVINAMMRKECHVLLAASGQTAYLLRREFPDTEILELPGYGMHYGRKGIWMPWIIASQLPKIWRAIRRENSWLRKKVREYGIDLVISDNRYGLHHPEIPSVFITHQLRIHTGLGAFMNQLVQSFNYRHIQRFSHCWIPDHPRELTLAGELSHPRALPRIPCYYTGPLTRFRRISSPEGNRLLILLSGPEPQRTLFEQLLLPQLSGYGGPVVLVRGLPGEAGILRVPAHIMVYNHLEAAALQQEFESAFTVIARCGYSTVMDLSVMRVKSILVPTPGQPEQEYLARHLMKRRFSLCIPQNKFRLPAALELSRTFAYQWPSGSGDGLEAAIGKIAWRR